MPMHGLLRPLWWFVSNLVIWSSWCSTSRWASFAVSRVGTTESSSGCLWASSGFHGKKLQKCLSTWFSVGNIWKLGQGKYLASSLRPTQCKTKAQLTLPKAHGSSASGQALGLLSYMQKTHLLLISIWLFIVSVRKVQQAGLCGAMSLKPTGQSSPKPGSRDGQTALLRQLLSAGNLQPPFSTSPCCLVGLEVSSFPQPLPRRSCLLAHVQPPTHTPPTLRRDQACSSLHLTFTLFVTKPTFSAGNIYAGENVNSKKNFPKEKKRQEKRKKRFHGGIFS